MPRSKSTAPHACELCRQRKRKCSGDGIASCKGCYEAGAECVYVATPRVSKGDLRDELTRLQTINSENNTLLDAISSKETNPIELNGILQQLSDGRPRAEVASVLTQRLGNVGGDKPELTSNVEVASGGDARGGSADSSALETSASSVTSELASKMERSENGISDKEARFRDNLTHYRSQLPQLLDTILARNCLLFCPINKEAFRRDFDSGYGIYCSTALVDALLALGSLLASEHVCRISAAVAADGDDNEALGDAFAQEAIAALYNGTGLPRRVADIQALSILSLYYLTRKKFSDSTGFAGDFGAAITEQWRTEQPIEPDSSTFPNNQVHASIYCAAISLNRIMFLIHDYDMTLDDCAKKVGMTNFVTASREGDATTTRLMSDASNSIIDAAFCSVDLGAIPDEPRVIAAKLFELTELIYKARLTPADTTLSQVLKVYNEVLRWYESFFQYTGRCSGKNTPMILFVHTYYQFCILCLLTPYIFEEVPIAVDGTLSESVCKQAANTVKELIQHYSRICLDGQLLDFMAVFEFAALSLLEISAAKATSRMAVESAFTE